VVGALSAQADTPNTFAFAIHPIDPKKDVARHYPILGRVLKEEQIHFLSTYWPPVYLSQIEGIRSIDSGVQTKGYFVGMPYTPRQMLSQPVERVYKKTIATGRLAERLGAKILGLGALIPVVGDAGITVADELDIAVTTGNSYTVAIVVRALIDAAHQMEIDISQATVAVVGATGSIGAASAELLAEQAGCLMLLARRERTLQRVRERCENYGTEIITSTDLSRLHEADVILSVSSAIGPIIEPEHLKPGAVVCDAAVPADVSARVKRERDDVLVIEGGMVEVPGPVNFNFNFGYPRGKAYACMAETMALALEGRFEDYTVGRLISVDKVREIDAIADRHGFRLSGFTLHNKAVSPRHIEQVLERANDSRRGWQPALT